MNQVIEAKILQRLKFIYKDDLPPKFPEKLLKLIEENKTAKKYDEIKWDEKEVVLITYGDSIISSGEKPLIILYRFLKKYLEDSINTVHILPFSPYSSDDGFSVIDYTQVDTELGSWWEIKKINRDFNLMVDLVINHISVKSIWFKNYLNNRHPGKNFFIEMNPAEDFSRVVRSRSFPLLTPFNTVNERKYIWTTFSEDQADLNFANPEVLYEMLKVLLLYVSVGAKIIRLDAIAYLWKQKDTACLNLPETHEIVKLIHDILEEVDCGVIILTETNLPNKENLSYFGKGDEAHMVYQFSLPPLLLHALYSGNSKYLNRWAKDIPDPPQGCTFFNFTASHDGIGVKPLEGLLPKDELDKIIEYIHDAGGKISTKQNSDGTDSPYELNITYFDALKQTFKGPDRFQVKRFLCSQTIMMTLRGVPAFYIHSLTATPNYPEGVKQTGHARTINRKKWELHDLEELLRNENNTSRVFFELIRRINIRKSEPVFHPDNPQKIYDTGSNFFVVKRKNAKKQNLLFSVSNLTGETKKINTKFLNDHGNEWIDLLSDRKHIISNKSLILQPYQTVWLKKVT